MSQKKIFFVCPTNPQPSGGVKQIYRMVDILNKNGFDASIVHKKAMHREKWFPNDTKIVNNPYLFKLLKYLDRKDLSFTKKLKLEYLKKISFKIDRDSILVFPEIYSTVNKIEPHTKKVIFNQNCYYSFNGFPLNSDPKTYPYNQASTLATIVVSENSKEYVLSAFTNPNVYRLHLGINNKIFNFSDNKKKTIAFMPRKLAEDITQVINIFRSRNPNSDWTFIPIDNKSENDVAETLKSCALFLSFNHKEGFGLPPVEAMSCGCYVIGYKGQAGKEYFKPEFSSPIDEGNIIGFVKEIEETIKIYNHNPQQILLKGKAAADFVLQNYNIEKEEKETIMIWNQIISLV